MVRPHELCLAIIVGAGKARQGQGRAASGIPSTAQAQPMRHSAPRRACCTLSMKRSLSRTVFGQVRLPEMNTTLHTAQLRTRIVGTLAAGLYTDRCARRPDTRLYTTTATSQRPLLLADVRKLPSRRVRPLAKRNCRTSLCTARAGPSHACRPFGPTLPGVLGHGQEKTLKTTKRRWGPTCNVCTTPHVNKDGTGTPIASSYSKLTPGGCQSASRGPEQQHACIHRERCRSKLGPMWNERAAASLRNPSATKAPGISFPPTAGAASSMATSFNTMARGESGREDRSSRTEMPQDDP